VHWAVGRVGVGDFCIVFSGWWASVRTWSFSVQSWKLIDCIDVSHVACVSGADSVCGGLLR